MPACLQHVLAEPSSAWTGIRRRFPIGHRIHGPVAQVGNRRAQEKSHGAAEPRPNGFYLRLSPPRYRPLSPPIVPVGVAGYSGDVPGGDGRLVNVRQRQPPRTRSGTRITLPDVSDSATHRCEHGEHATVREKGDKFQETVRLKSSRGASTVRVNAGLTNVSCPSNIERRWNKPWPRRAGPGAAAGGGDFGSEGRQL